MFELDLQPQDDLHLRPGVAVMFHTVVMARITTRIIVSAFGGGEVVELVQAPEPKNLKLAGYLEAYAEYFGEPVAQLRSSVDGHDLR